MGHLCISDVVSLQLHNELGDILDPKDFIEITKHLDSCDICKKRYYWKDGKVKDRKEKIEEDLFDMTDRLAKESNGQCPTVVEAYEFMKDRHEHKEKFDVLFTEYKLYGGTINTLLSFMENKVKLAGFH